LDYQWFSSQQEPGVSEIVSESAVVLTLRQDSTELHEYAKQAEVVLPPLEEYELPKRNTHAEVACHARESASVAKSCQNQEPLFGLRELAPEFLMVRCNHVKTRRR
jgi:hypothetical protein